MVLCVYRDNTNHNTKTEEIKMNYNARTVTMKLKRIEVCDLLVALTAVVNSSDSKKWAALHDKVKAILDKFDKDNLDERAG